MASDRHRFSFFSFGILDNAAIHHVPEVRDIIQGTGALLIYLPPYSSDFNPLEEVFSKVTLREMSNSWNLRGHDISRHPANQSLERDVSGNAKCRRVSCY